MLCFSEILFPLPPCLSSPASLALALQFVRMAQFWRFVEGFLLLIGANSFGHLPGLSPASLTAQLKDARSARPPGRGPACSGPSSCSSGFQIPVNPSWILVRGER